MSKSNYSDGFYKFVRICIYVAELFVLFSIQQVPGFLPEVCGGRPVLILPLLLSVSLAEGNYLSLIWGLVSGLILDLSQSQLMGAQILIMGIVGYGLGKLREKLFEVNFFTFAFLSFLLEPILIFIRFYVNYMTSGMVYADIAIYNHVIPSILYTVFVSPVIYLFNRPILFFVSKKGGVRD